MDESVRQFVRHRAGHFEHRGHLILGKTDVGRTTVVVLNMNEANRVKLRRGLLDQGEEL